MFHKAVCRLYMKAFHYSTTHLPLSDELLKNATLLNFKLRTQCTFSQVEYLVQRYACAMYCCYCPNDTARQTGNGEWDRTDICMMFLSFDLIIPFVSLGSVPCSLLNPPLSLLNAVFMFNGINLVLRGGQEHHGLKSSQFTFVRREDTNDPASKLAF